MPVESTDLLAVTRPTGAGQGTYKIAVGDLPVPNARAIVSATAPTTTTHPDLIENDLWYDTVNKQLFIYIASNWEATTTPTDLTPYSTTVQSDAKYVDVAGDTMTGALSVPAGATTTQAPQVQEVVLKAGDTMTGPLTVPNATVPGVIDNPGVAKAWGYVDTVGTLVAGFNCASVTRLGLGVYQINFATPMSSGKYAALVVGGFTPNVIGNTSNVSANLPTSFKVDIVANSGAAIDQAFAFVVFAD